MDPIEKLVAAVWLVSMMGLWANNNEALSDSQYCLLCRKVRDDAWRPARTMTRWVFKASLVALVAWLVLTALATGPNFKDL